MSVQRTTVRSARSIPSRPYAQVSLVDLIERVVEKSDTIALHELHNHRTPFRIGGQPHRMSLTAFVLALCEMPWTQRLCGHNRLVVEQAYDLAIDRFSRLTAPESRSGGSDCRLYFGNVLRSVRTWAADHEGTHDLQLETAAARILQQRVTSHTWLCCREASRMRHPTRTRYAWRLNGAAIHVWMPAALSGHRRRLWLETNIPDASPQRNGETARVQAIIDEHFGVPRVLSLSDLPAIRSLDDPSKGAHVLSEDRPPIELAATIAEEKAQKIAEQRPAIRLLGPQRLRQLILEIFRGLTDGEYNQEKIAIAYGLKPPSLSRFAGKDWKDIGHVPDLWVNCSHVLAEDDDYVETAIAAGVWDIVSAVLENSRRNKEGQA